MKQGRTLTELAKEVERQRDTKVDLVASTEVMQVRAKTYANAPGGDVTIAIGNDREFGINGTGHTQIAGHTGIPTAYYKKMEAEAPDLLADNVNRWFQKYPAQAHGAHLGRQTAGLLVRQLPPAGKLRPRRGGAARPARPEAWTSCPVRSPRRTSTSRRWTSA